MFVLVRENVNCDYTSVIAVSDSIENLEKLANENLTREITLYEDENDDEKYSIVKTVSEVSSRKDTLISVYKNQAKSYLFEDFRILNVKKV